MMFDIYPLTRSNRSSVYDPFKAMDAMEKRFVSPFAFFTGDNTPESFRIDIKEADDSFTLEADLPGFDKKDIALDLDGDCLTIKAERHSEYEDKDKKNSYVRWERSYGKYQRSFDLTGIDTEAISAKYDNGVLTLTLPKKVPVAPAKKQVEIQ